VGWWGGGGQFLVLAGWYPQGFGCSSPENVTCVSKKGVRVVSKIQVSFYDDFTNLSETGFD
jgi:hypothetical protein